jgi:DNA-binding transcriptional regulator YhcF (GntR family)
MAGSARQIAEVLRRRIATGALGPGDALPSVRALSRRWQVAPGTAARALQVLVHEGLAKAVPKSGVRVLGATLSDDRVLSRERIVAAAIRLADQAGLEAFSVRALAEVLGAAPMSLYRHVENKEQLVWLMVEAAFAEEALPQVEGVGWREGLERASRQEWRVMRRHPWLARAVSITRPGTQPTALAFADRVMQALEGTALNGGEKLQLHVLLHGFVQGLAVNVEAEVQARSESGIDEAAFMRGQEAAFAEIAASGRFPFFARMLATIPSDFDLDVDVLFEHGLAALLRGVAPAVEGGRRKRRPLRRAAAPGRPAGASRGAATAPR